MEPLTRIELVTSPLPRECSATELQGPATKIVRLHGAGEGNRTLVVSLEGFCSTIELHPLRTDTADTQNQSWWWGKDSNLRRQSRQIYSLIPLTAREPHRTEPAILVAHTIKVKG